jgi:hypothetical protein
MALDLNWLDLFFLGNRPWRYHLLGFRSLLSCCCYIICCIALSTQAGRIYTKIYTEEPQCCLKIKPTDTISMDQIPSSCRAIHMCIITCSVCERPKITPVVIYRNPLDGCGNSARVSIGAISTRLPTPALPKPPFLTSLLCTHLPIAVIADQNHAIPSYPQPNLTIDPSPVETQSQSEALGKGKTKTSRECAEALSATPSLLGPGKARQGKAMQCASPQFSAHLAPQRFNSPGLQR